MSQTAYSNLFEISKLQTDIMLYITDWVHTKKVPVSQRDIVKNMAIGEIKDYTVVRALEWLMKAGYLRKACIMSNKTYYVQLRSL